jgi:hypothetical protein
MSTDPDDKGQSALDDVFASGRDRDSDSAESVAKQADAPVTEAEPKPETADAEAEGGQPKQQYRDPENGRFVPLTELKTERGKRQEEARLRAEAENRAARAEAALDEARRYADRFQGQQHYPQPQHQPQRPDPITDPEGYELFLRMQAVSERLNISQMMAEDKHGEELVDKATQAAIRVGLAERFVQMRNPYASIVDWYKRQSALAEIGDPADYEKRIRGDERQKLLAEMKNGSGNPQQRFPGTLADVPTSGPNGSMPLSEQQMMDSLFASDRSRR